MVNVFKEAVLLRKVKNPKMPKSNPIFIISQKLNFFVPNTLSGLHENTDPISKAILKGSFNVLDTFNKGAAIAIVQKNNYPKNMRSKLTESIHITRTCRAYHPKEKVSSLFTYYKLRNKAAPLTRDQLLSEPAL